MMTKGVIGVSNYIVSQKYKLTIEDIKKIVKNAIIFLAPVLIILLIDLQNGRQIDMAYLKLWALNIVIDVLKKFIAENKYQK